MLLTSFTKNDLLIMAIILLLLIVYYIIIHGVLSIIYYFLSKKIYIFKTRWRFLYSFIVSLIPFVVYLLMFMRKSRDFLEVTDVHAEFISNSDECFLYDTTSIHKGIVLEFHGDYVSGRNASMTLTPSKRMGLAGVAYPIKKFEVNGYKDNSSINITGLLCLKNVEYQNDCKYEGCWKYYKERLYKDNITLGEFIEDINDHKEYTREITAEVCDAVPFWFPDYLDCAWFDSIVLHAVFTHDDGDVDIYRTVKQPEQPEPRRHLSEHEADNSFAVLVEDRYFPCP